MLPQESLLLSGVRAQGCECLGNTRSLIRAQSSEFGLGAGPGAGGPGKPSSGNRPRDRKGGRDGSPTAGLALLAHRASAAREAPPLALLALVSPSVPPRLSCLRGRGVLVVLAPGLPSRRGALGLPLAHSYGSKKMDHMMPCRAAPVPRGGHRAAPLDRGPSPGTRLQQGGRCPQSSDAPLRLVASDMRVSHVWPRGLPGPSRTPVAPLPRQRHGQTGKAFSGAGESVQCGRAVALCCNASAHATLDNSVAFLVFFLLTRTSCA